MRRIVVSEFMSVDGVMEDPGGAEGFNRGGWAFQFDRGSEGDKFKLDEVMDADAMLLGRVTYEGFAAAWPQRTDDAGFADKMNSMQKFVVSNTLTEPLTWANSVLLLDVAAVKALPDGPGLTLLGSGALLRALLAEDLVDELLLLVHPIVLGAGQRMFAADGPHARLRLVDATPTGAGVVITQYAREDGR